MIVVNFVLAMLPILWLMVALSVLKMPGFKACGIAALIAMVLALIYWRLHPFYVGAAALEGVLNALWPICIVIIAALFTYNLTIETGAMEGIKAMLSGVSTDGRILMLIVAWGFGNFMEGMAGFGTAVAIPAGILVALGFDPVKTVVACLVINSMPTAFGSVGVPTETLGSVTGLDAGLLAANVVVIEALLIFISPFLMILIFGGPKALKGVWGITLVSSLSFLIPMFLVGYFIGPQMPNTLGSVCCLVCTILYAKKVQKGETPQEYISGTSAKGEGSLTLGSALKDWSPFILILVLLLITSLVPAVHDPLSAIKSVVHVYPEEGAGALTFAWVNTPGVIILLAACVGGLIQGASPLKIIKVFGKTLKNNWKTVFTICCVVATAKIMDHSGMTRDISALLVRTGSFFPLVSPLIGVLGAFITGSGTSTNVLFGGMQAMTAEGIGLNPAWLAAANAMGAGIGKMISPQCIAIGLAAVSMAGKESEILKHVTKYCVLYTVIGGLVCYFLPLLGIVVA